MHAHGYAFIIAVAVMFGGGLLDGVCGDAGKDLTQDRLSDKFFTFTHIVMLSVQTKHNKKRVALKPPFQILVGQQ